MILDLYIDNGALWFLIGAQLISQPQQLRAERSELHANELLIDFLHHSAVIWLQRLRSRKSQHLPLGCIYWVSHLPPSLPPLSIASSLYSALLCWKYLVTNIPVQFLPSSCETFLATSHLQVSWLFPTTNMSKCLNIFEKSYRNLATFNFRIGKYPG